MKQPMALTLMTLAMQTTDSDGDGITNANEVAMGTNPKSADSDGDGQNDGSEQNSGSDPSNEFICSCRC